MLTEENYAKVKELFRARLDRIASESYYTIRMDKSTGKVYIQVLDSTYTDTISSVIVDRGVFEMTPRKYCLAMHKLKNPVCNIPQEILVERLYS